MIVKETSKEYFRGLTIIHFALCNGLIFMGLILYFIIGVGTASNAEDVKLFTIIVSLFAIIGIFYNMIIYPKRLKQIKQEQSVIEKSISYRANLIVRYAFWEAPAIFSMVSVIITNELFFYIPAGIFFLLMIFYRPTKERFINELELKAEEVSLIQDPSAIISEIKRR